MNASIGIGSVFMALGFQATFIFCTREVAAGLRGLIWGGMLWFPVGAYILARGLAK